MLLVGDFIPKTLSVKLPPEFAGQLVLANLEGPICSDNLPKSNKVGVCLHTSQSLQVSCHSPELVDEQSKHKTIQQTNNSSRLSFAFSLANNHMMDFRWEGVQQTLEFLRTATAENVGFECAGFAGVGEDEESARRPMILQENGHRIAVFSCCERQFGMASIGVQGCAAKGVWLYKAIQEIKATGAAGFVIVSCHAANEFSPWVSPELHDFYHSLIDVGADVVHGHHAHVPQGYEEYRGRPIFYGLGNFVVDWNVWKNNFNQTWSIVVDLKFDKVVTWTVKPYLVQRKAGIVSVVPEQSLEVCESYLEHCNAQFTSREMLLACWQESVCRLYQFLYGKVLRTPPVVNQHLSIKDRVRLVYFAIWELFRALIGCERKTERSVFYGKVIFNAFNCESHIDSIQTALGVFTGVVGDCRSGMTAQLATLLGVGR